MKNVINFSKKNVFLFGAIMFMTVLLIGCGDNGNKQVKEEEGRLFEGAKPLPIPKFGNNKPEEKEGRLFEGAKPQRIPKF